MVKMLGCVLLLKRLRSGHACDWIRRDHITWVPATPLTTATTRVRVDRIQDACLLEYCIFSLVCVAGLAVGVVFIC